jgi:hypothetical protein
VNELHVSGDKASDEDTRRILQSIGEARKKADMVIVYEHNHIFAKPLQTIISTLVATVARFRDTTGMKGLLRGVGAISQLSGMRYLVSLTLRVTEIQRVLQEKRSA